jgi:hypothetical protein
MILHGRSQAVDTDEYNQLGLHQVHHLVHRETVRPGIPQ